jgi:adenylate kinase
VYISTGYEFRKLVTAKNHTGALIKDMMDRGELMPDFLTDSVVSNMLVTSLTDQKHLITDGYPRTPMQSENLAEMLQFYKREDIKVIFIGVGKDEAMKRNLVRGRSDDTKEGLEKRFDEYVEKVLPAFEYFRNKENYKIYTINGEQLPENVHKDIIKALGYE